jgi:hypothetical protein
LQNLSFEVDKIYVDREGTKYIFVERRAGVTIFKEYDGGKNHVKNLNGQYRWDNKEDKRDIIGEYNEQSDDAIESTYSFNDSKG